MSDPKHHLNILIFSNSTWYPTGYGTLCKNFSRALVDAGYGVVVAAYVGLQGAPQADGYGIVHLPVVREQFMNDVIQAHYRYAQTHFPNHQPTDMVWSIVDIFAMDAFVWQNMPWASQTPIDCEPVLQNMRTQLSVCRWPIAVSRHAETQMKLIGLKPLFVPWGIPTDVFVPIDRSLARQNMVSKSLINRVISDETFLITVVGNNGQSYRKNFAGMFEAYKIFLETHPDSLMYCHTESTGVHGIPLDAMVEQFGLKEHVIFPMSYAMLCGLPNDANLIDVYSAGDVKLMLSMGESPGLTDLEAQSCGLPIIATNFSSSIEVNFTGWKVDGSMFQHVPLSYQMRPDPFEAVRSLNEAYDLWKAGGMPELRARTRTATHAWDVKTIMKDHFIPALDFIAEDLKRTPHAEWLRRREKINQRRSDIIRADWGTQPSEDQIKIRQAMANARAVTAREKIRARW